MLCDVGVGRWWDDMWVVLIVGSITETHAAPDASLKTELSRGLRPANIKRAGNEVYERVLSFSDTRAGSDVKAPHLPFMD